MHTNQSQTSFMDPPAVQLNMKAACNDGDMSHPQNTTTFPAMPMEPLGYSSFFIPPYNPHLGRNMDAQAALFVPTHGLRSTTFMAAEAGVPSEYLNFQPTTTEGYYPVQSQTPTPMQLQQGQNQRPFGQILLPSQQCPLRCCSQGRYTSPSFMLTPQQTPQQLSQCADLQFDTFSASNSPTTDANNPMRTTQQFSQQQPGRSVTPRFITTVTELPSSQIPGKHSRTPHISNAIVPTPSPPYQTTRSTFTETAYQNEVAEHTRLEKEQKQRAEAFKIRREELRKDTSAIYHRYNEVLEYLPPSRGERPNPYLASLLANQTMPIEPTSDRGIAIAYAKKHWENFWELKDLQYVISKARADGDDQ